MTGWLPPLQALRAFVAAARHNSFTRAGAELALTSGAVAHHVRALEDLMGAALFERVGRRVRVTAEGRRLARRLEAALGDLETVMLEVRPRSRAGLAVTMQPAFAAKWFLPRLAAIRRALPDVELRVHASPVLAELGRDGLDCAIRFGRGPWLGTDGVPLADETVFPVASPTLVGNRPNLAAEAVLALPLIRHARQPWTTWLRAAGLPHGEPPPAIVFDDAALVIDAAVAGHGVALARGRIAERDLVACRLVRLTATTTPDPAGYWFLTRPDAPPAAADLCRWLQAEMAAPLKLEAEPS